MLSNTAKYAIRALIYLANYATDGKKIGIKQMSDELGIPFPFLGKIMQSLAKEKILISNKGPRGGFALNRKPEEISLYDIIVMIDNDDYFQHCIIRPVPCSCFTDEVTTCAIHRRFSNLRNEIASFYKDTKLADIIDDFEISGGTNVVI